MPTINQNVTSSISLSAGRWIEVEGTGIAVPQIGPTKGQPQTITNFGKVGPFDFAQTVSLTATGSRLSYTILDDWPDARAEVDESGNPTGQLVTPDGDPVVVGAFSVNNSATLFGDSLQENEWSNAFNAYSDRGAAVWLGILGSTPSGPLVEPIYNYGIGGDTLENMLTRVDTALAAPTDIFIFRGGLNSVNTLGFAAWSSAYDELLSKMSAAKPVVLVETMSPLSSTTTANKQFLTHHNNEIRRLCKKYSNVICLNNFDPLVDPTSLNGDALTNTLFDGTHYSGLGGFLLGRAMREELSGRLSTTPYYTVIANTVPALTGSSGTFTPGSGTITGDSPHTGYNVRVLSGNAAVACTRLTNGMRLTITAAADSVILYSNTGTLDSQLPAGSKIKIGAKFKVGGQTGVFSVHQALYAGTTLTLKTIDRSTTTWPQYGWMGHQRSRTYTIQPSDTGLYGTSVIGVSAGGSCYVDILEPEVLRIA